jgi:predicted DCC family thiol-disulfide oxidoreductase YuxK
MILSSDSSGLIVYFDGSCPLCRAEIGYYRKQAGAEGLGFFDVSKGDFTQTVDLTEEAAMSRFHVRQRDGQLVSGAAAFVVIWGQLPRWQWAARIAGLPGAITMLETSYRLFLPLRPSLAWIFGKLQRANRRT